MWCFTLPLVLVDSLKWRMIPTVLTVCWALFIIEEVGHIIEVSVPSAAAAAAAAAVVAAAAGLWSAAAPRDP